MFRYISRLFARQVIRRIAVIAVGAFFMLLPALWGGLQASAATNYDSSFVRTDNVVLRDDFYNEQCGAFDITDNWISTVLDETKTQFPNEDAKQSLRNAILDNEIPGRWGVSVYRQEHTSVEDYLYKTATIFWTEDTDLFLEIGATEKVSQVSRVSGGDIWRADVYIDSTGPAAMGCHLVVSANQGKTIEVSNYTDDEENDPWWIRNYLLYVDPENMSIPEGYTGDMPSASPQPPISGEDYAPKWTILTANNWKAEIRDLRFATFDGIFWTCKIEGEGIQSGSDGHTPVIEWELLNENNTLIEEGVLSAGAHWNYQFDEYNEDRTYKIKGRYYCGGETTFNTVSEKEFTITSTGLLKEQDFFAQCVMLEPPFVAVQSCIENVFRVIEILSFNQFNLVTGLNSTENCRQLVVLGHWINKPYEVVCPQFSQTVRNTVTPFVTFILGLFTAMVIMRVMNNRGMS